jgi:hypothetical protein
MGAPAGRQKGAMGGASRLAIGVVGVALGATLLVGLAAGPCLAGTVSPSAPMTTRIKNGVLFGSLSILLAGPLQGPPCGQVVSAVRQSAVRQGDNDYVASCRDGNRYHVFTSAQGRVVVQKQ